MIFPSVVLYVAADYANNPEDVEIFSQKHRFTIRIQA
jgi:hypothetical protein